MYINPILRNTQVKYTSDLSIHVSSGEVYTFVFYLEILNKYYVTVTLGGTIVED